MTTGVLGLLERDGPWRFEADLFLAGAACHICGRADRQDTLRPDLDGQHAHQDCASAGFKTRGAPSDGIVRGSWNP